MEKLNYIREFKSQHIVKLASEYRKLNCPLYARFVREFIEQSEASMKFVLPVNGKIIDDDLNGLGAIRLPYDSIAIEFFSDGVGGVGVHKEGFGFPLKNVVLARKAFDNGAPVIRICFGYLDRGMSNYWQLVPGFLQIPETEVDFIPIVDKQKDRVLIPNLTPLFFLSPELHKIYGADVTKDDKAIVGLKGNLMVAAFVLFGLLEALSCSNVFPEKVPNQKIKKGERLSAKKEDEYHTLIVRTTNSDSGAALTLSEQQTDRRPAREHLRRGHVRRLQNGKKIWINPMVVNAGVGGKIFKDYAMAA
jgi:hypothetical protein